MNKFAILRLKGQNNICDKNFNNILEQSKLKHNHKPKSKFNSNPNSDESNVSYAKSDCPINCNENSKLAMSKRNSKQNENTIHQEISYIKTDISNLRNEFYGMKDTIISEIKDSMIKEIKDALLPIMKEEINKAIDSALRKNERI